jgi:dimethylaniline monooxygenase (N-oxide forming)
VKSHYEFPELRFPKEVPEYVPVADVVAYAEEFVRKFELHGCLRLRTEVLCVKRTSRDPAAPAFEVTSRGPDGAAVAETFTFVAICNGMCSAGPNIPEFKGADTFKGAIVNSSQWRSLEEMHGKRVLVVGNGKSAMDAALESCRVASATVHAMRTAHWHTPRKVLNVLPYKFALFPRATMRLLPLYPGTRYSPLYPRRARRGRAAALGVLARDRGCAAHAVRAATTPVATRATGARRTALHGARLPQRVPARRAPEEN